ncbi:MAG: ABC transporter substrate-binding protein [Candidatus Rokuibacteriota bacterium]
MHLGRFALALALLAAPLSAEAQPTGKVARPGVLLLSSADPNLDAFRRGLRELGHIEGRNLVIEYRAAEGNAGRLADLAVELVQLKPDVLFALGGNVAPFAKHATRTVPIVMVTSADPVRGGLVASLARPGGNVTGVTFLSADLAAKRLQFLKEVAPTISRVGLLWNPDHADDEFAETQAAARTLGIQLQSLEVRASADFEGAFQAAVTGRAEAIIVVSSRQMTLNRARILEFARSSKLPLACGWGPWAQGGALLSYGPDQNLLVRRAATYVDKILRGAKPADLPVEQPTKVELIINLRQGSRPHHPAVAAAAGRSGHRMSETERTLRPELGAPERSWDAYHVGPTSATGLKRNRLTATTAALAQCQCGRASSPYQAPGLSREDSGRRLNARGLRRTAGPS